MNWKRFEMREHIRQSNLIEGVPDPEEVDQSLLAWEFLMDQPVLTHPVMHQTHRLIMAGRPMPMGDVQRGTYRDATRYNCEVGNHLPPPWYAVPALMDDWLAGHNQRSPWRNHGYFEGVHPRADGNGREGRFYLWRQEILEGREPTMIVADFHEDYFRRVELERRLHLSDLRESRGVS